MRALWFDVDDTLTTGGRVSAQAAAALWRAHDAGMWLCAVTGRGAGWCDMMLRHWPVDAVVGETGAFSLERGAHGRVRWRFLRTLAQRRKDLEQRRAAVELVLAQVPGARLAQDSAWRLCDVAFDLTEEGPPWPPRRILRVMELLAGSGLTVARSSVHINAWVGHYGKREMVQRLLESRAASGLPRDARRHVYVGDSRNDGPMFKFFPLSVGVANVVPLLPELHALGQVPRFVTGRSHGAGFVELVNALLRARGKG